MKHHRLCLIFFLWAALLCNAAQAQTTTNTVRVTRFSPQGEVAQVRQVVVQLDAAAVPLGDTRAPAPVSIACSKALTGHAHWVNEREWVFDFDQDLPAGIRCTVLPTNGFKTPTGATLATAGLLWSFHTGGPFVQRIFPYEHKTIEEEQFFLLRLNGAAKRDSVLQHVWCSAEGLGERIAVRLIEGEQRAALLRHHGVEKAAREEPGRFVTLTCARRLTEGSKLQLVYGAGVEGDSGIANKVEKRFAFTVREPFRAEFHCERENARTSCLPMMPMRLTFNAPVPWEVAKNIRLNAGDLSLEPEDADSLVDAVRFMPPGEHKLFPLQTTFTLTLPTDFKDASGRPLANAASFPLQVATGEMPPLAKFAAAPFGILERYAEGPEGTALLPVTLRRVEGQLAVQGMQPAGGQTREPQQVVTLQSESDVDIIQWLRRVKKYDRFWVSRSAAEQDAANSLPPPLDKEDDGQVQARMVSLLQGKNGVKTLNVPPADEPRPFEVVGIPLPAGFHVVEVASPLLGEALLDTRYGKQRTMYVRTAALVTNLGVHFKLGRENAVAWVTTLDQAKPVANARVQVSDCNGNLLTTAVTNAQGVAQLEGLSARPPRCDKSDDDDAYWEDSAYFVSARTADDMAFVWSDWDHGIETWRFGFSTNSRVEPHKIVHTVFDRTLLRAGETVSMKHLLRDQTHTGFAVTLPAQRPEKLLITHQGSGQNFELPVHWRVTTTGGLSAETQWRVPPAAKLGVYQVRFSSDGYWLDGGSFRVEEFRLPVLEGRIAPPKEVQPLVRPSMLPAQMQVNYIAGGAAAQLPVKVSAMLRGIRPQWAEFDTFRFTSPNVEGYAMEPRVIADKLPVTLDDNGVGSVTITDIPQAEYAQEVVLEATYADPSGEVQTIRSTHTLWPASVAVGIKVDDSWVSAGKNVRMQALALGLNGTVQANIPLQIRGIAHITTTTRKRLVGGFYSYDNHTEKKDLGVLCSGTSDSRGLLACTARVDMAGQIELIASATDAANNTVEAGTSVWVTRQGELWFGGEDHDRIDVLPEKTHYQPGETARLQVRMPFREATALVSIEREGIIDTRVMPINGQDPTLAIKIEPDWSPNVYISVLVVRGRLRDVPWYSFFTWGFKQPAQWWSAWRGHACKEGEGGSGGECAAPPTAMVDLSKPAYRMGVTQLFVDHAGNRIDVQVTADQASYPIRGKAQVTISATLPDGRPAAGAEVALAAVDEALLELMPNTSWKLLEAMLQQRAWGVTTATAHMEIIGRRHYGKKAAPAGGGGGKAQTRELLDTLLLWQPAIALDAQGKASITVPLNDALTRFKIVAVADAGTGFFGTGETSIRATQDLQIISGLPPLVREGDDFRAQFTLRNTMQKDMQVKVTPLASMPDTTLPLEPQTVTIPAGAAREVAWDVSAPAALGATRAETLRWDVEAVDSQSGARDAIRISQRVTTPVPLTIMQATLEQLDGALEKDTALPKGALPLRSGLKVTLQSSLSQGLPAVRDWWANYPYACLEQKASKAIGLRDDNLWKTLMAELPTYLDANGLAHYFPPSEADDHNGSDTLTAYLLAASHETAGLYRGFTLPAATRDAMLAGLTAFVTGNIERNFWSPRQDLGLRKLAALEALSRYNRVRPSMLESITIAPNQWPTHAVLDWINILQRTWDLPQRQQHLDQAMAIVRARLSFQGSKLIFSTERDDYYWWLMQNGDVNSARLILTVLKDEQWKDDMGRLVNGFIARQKSGVWHSTTANLWGALALEKFAAARETEPVTGTTHAAMGGKAGAIDWARINTNVASDSASDKDKSAEVAGIDAWPGAPVETSHDQSNSVFLPWTRDSAAGRLSVNHQGTGKPWLAVQSVVALIPEEPIAAGYTITRSITPLQQADPSLPEGVYTRGDILRIKLQITAATDMTWVAVTDPIPAGATILGSGLGRDSAIATQGEKRSGNTSPVFQERAFEAFRSYYRYVPKGRFSMEYTVRLNNVGDFSLPPSRVEALYAPEIFGMWPNGGVKVVMP